MGIGEWAALGAALCWAIAALFFRNAGTNIRPLVLNGYKGVAGCVMLMFAIWIVGGDWSAASRWDVLLVLLASGAIGIGVGDTAFFAALNELGERRTLLIAETMAPPLALLIAFLALQEALSLGGLLGMAVTVGGVAWVIIERSSGESEAKASVRSCVLALCAAACQATGAVMSRYALAGSEVGPYVSSFLRLLGGLAVTTLWLVVLRSVRTDRGREGTNVDAGNSVAGVSGTAVASGHRVWLNLLSGTLIGTFLGIVLQQTALKHSFAAMTQTLIATSVLFVLPLLALRGERVSRRAWLGAAVAVSGVAILCFSGQ